jgi:hypothetical protein
MVQFVQESTQNVVEQLCQTGTSATEAKKMVDEIVRGGPHCIVTGRMEPPNKCPIPRCLGLICINPQGSFMGVDLVAAGKITNLARDIAAAKGTGP